MQKKKPNKTAKYFLVKEAAKKMKVKFKYQGTTEKNIKNIALSNEVECGMLFNTKYNS